MPSEHSPGESRDRKRFPKLKDDYGEDPARWLDCDILGHSDRKRLVEARIEGIDEIALVRAWIAVERRLDRDTRQGIITRLERREEQLQQIGERPDRVTDRDGREIPDKQVYRVDADGERVPWKDADRSTGLPSSRCRDQPVATDGGE